LRDLAAAMMCERRAEHVLDGGHAGSYNQCPEAETIAIPVGLA